MRKTLFNQSVLTMRARKTLTLFTAFVLFGFTLNSCKDCGKKEAKPAGRNDSASSEELKKPKPAGRNDSASSKEELKEELKNVMIAKIKDAGSPLGPLAKALEEATNIFNILNTTTTNYIEKKWWDDIHEMCYCRTKYADKIAKEYHVYTDGKVGDVSHGSDSDVIRVDADGLEGKVKLIYDKASQHLNKLVNELAEKGLVVGTEAKSFDHLKNLKENMEAQLPGSWEKLKEVMPKANKAWKELTEAVDAYRKAINPSN
jgi:polyhydroxyalkanoate synthesis regulator phasin